MGNDYSLALLDARIILAWVNKNNHKHGYQYFKKKKIIEEPKTFLSDFNCPWLSKNYELNKIKSSLSR